MVFSMRVKDVMDKKVIPVDSGLSVAEATRKMAQENVWSLVVEERGLAEGIVAERDIIGKCLAKGLTPRSTTVMQIMSSPLITISPDASIREALETLVEKNVRLIFIVEEAHIIGRVTQTGLLKSVFDVMSTLSSLPEQF